MQMRWERESRLFLVIDFQPDANSVFFFSSPQCECQEANDRKIFFLSYLLRAVYSKVHGNLRGTQRQRWPKMYFLSKNIMQDGVKTFLNYAEVYTSAWSPRAVIQFKKVK